MANEVLCYNKGCGKTYDPNLNTDVSCIHHPGVPVFHDALKGWSCCKRRTTDFTDFLNIPGCSKGKHSNEKPQQPIKPKVSSSKTTDAKEKPVVVLQPPMPKPIKIVAPMMRPSADEPTIPLSFKSTASLKKALEKLSLGEKNQGDTLKQIKICQHLSCKSVYTEGIDEVCIHHPGGPVFHEGMKYWSCCNRKTSDFTAFLSQEGCVKGTHEWKLKSAVESAPCRYDWHQTGSVVVMSIFAKTTMEDNSSVRVNQIKLEIDLEYEGGKRNFKSDMELGGVIDPSHSFVTLYGTKVEITMKKADASKWKDLKFEKEKNAEEKKARSENQPDEKEPKQEPPMQQKTCNGHGSKDENDDSDLSGIDDMEFD